MANYQSPSLPLNKNLKIAQEYEAAKKLVRVLSEKPKSLISRYYTLE